MQPTFEHTLAETNAGLPSVRCFRGADTRSALAAVKAAFGPEALILATREVAGRHFWQKEIEVTASPPGVPPPVAPGTYRPLIEVPPATQRVEHHRATPAVPPMVRDLQRALDDTNAQLRRLSLEGAATKDLELPPHASRIFAHLSLRGVDDSIAEELVRQAMSEGGDPRQLLAVVSRLVGEYLVPSHAPWLSQGRMRSGPHIMALVGPTGVGKTTTVAKIAARAVTESGLAVALVTVDNYRVGAKEQLARYASIMNVPLHVARDRKELSRVMGKCAAADLVLIDTAGRAGHADVARQAELVRSIKGVALHLVLSAATGARQIGTYAARFRSLEPNRLIFSKLDETDAPGGVLTAALKIMRPVSCVTDGQRVPEDLHAATAERLVNLVVGA